MSEGEQVTSYKYNYEQTLDWANREPDLKEDGTTFLYVFGGIAFLFLFAALLLFSTNGRKSKASANNIDNEDFQDNKIEELVLETDATSSDTAVEFDLVEDLKKDKKVKEPAK